MKNIQNKILIIMLVTVIVFTSVTEQYKVPTKAGVAGAVLAIEEIIALVIGSQASMSIGINNGGIIPRAKFDRAYNSICDNIAQAKINNDMALSNLVYARTPAMLDFAYKAVVYAVGSEQDTGEWRHDPRLDQPIGGNPKNGTLRELQAELNDIALEDVELWQDTYRKNHPTEPPENNSGGPVKFLLGLIATTMIGIGVVRTAEELGTYDFMTNTFWNPETGEQLDPKTGLPIDPETGLVKLENGKLMDSKTGKMYDPITLEEFEPIYANNPNMTSYIITGAQTINKLGDYVIWNVNNDLIIPDTYENYKIGGYKQFDSTGNAYYMIMENYKYNGKIVENFKNVLIKGQNYVIKYDKNGNIINNKWFPWESSTSLINYNLGTNIPLFETKVDMQNYFKGIKDIIEAINYGVEDDDNIPEVSEGTKQAVQKLDEMRNKIQQIKDHFEDNNMIQDDMIQDIEDEVQRIKDYVNDETVPDKTPEDVADKIIDDYINPIVAPWDNPTIPTDPTDPTEPIDPVVPTDPAGEGKIGGVLGTVFPFCIPFDLINMVKAFKAPPKAPYFEIPVVFEPLGLDEKLIIDFNKFEPIAKIFRVFAVLGFITALILLSRNLIKG